MATAERRSARVYRNCISRAAMIPSKLANRPSAGVLRRGGPTRIPASCSTRMLRREKSAHPPYNDMQPAHLPMQSGSNAEIAIATIRGVISRRESAQVRTGCRRERDRRARATFAAATLLELLSKARPGRRYQPACRHRTEYLCQRKQSQNVPCSIFETARLSSSQLRAHFDSSDSERISLRARAPVGPPLLFSRLTN